MIDSTKTVVIVIAEMIQKGQMALITANCKYVKYIEKINPINDIPSTKIALKVLINSDLL